MASWIMKNVKDGSRRIKDELARSIGFTTDGSLDPVLDYRTQRFNRYNDSLEKLSKAVTHYLEATQTYSHASSGLMHAFSEFFEAQLDGCAPDDEDYVPTKSLAQGALRLEEVYQSLRENAFDTAREMQQQVVARSIQQLKQKNAQTQRQLQALKQKLIEYDSVRRSAESQKRNTPEYERAQQRVQATEAMLVGITNDINTDLNTLEARRSTDLRNELLAVVASQIYMHSRAYEHLQQLLPMLPGIAKPMMLLAEHTRARPHANPAVNTVMGVVSYVGESSRGVVEIPVASAAGGPMPAPADVASVHPFPPKQPFTEMHFGEKLAVATYGR